MRLLLLALLAVASPVVVATAGWSEEYVAQPVGVECSILRPGDCPRLANANVHFVGLAPGRVVIVVVDDFVAEVGAMAVSYAIDGTELDRVALCKSASFPLHRDAVELVVEVDAAWRPAHCDGTPTGTRGIVFVALE